MAQHVFKLVCTCLWLLLLVQELCNAAPATQQAIQNTSTTTVRPITDQIKASASNEEADDADVKPVPPTTGNGNVYGAANAGNSGGGGGGGGEAGGTQSNRPSNRGYNQGYSYNTGIKPYRTGYTYFQPFGDAADQQNQDQSGNSSGSKGGGGGGGKAAGNADNSQQQVPVEISNMLGIDPKQFGPVKVIPNQNVPVDENGIPNLDAIKIPENNQQQQQVQVQPRMRPVAAPVRPVAQPQVPVNPSDFSMGNDFNLNQILGSGNGAARPRPVQQQQQQYNPANDNSMFDFAPPSNQNFNFDNQNNGGGGARDYNRLDNFAGNLNNFDTYLGDAGLMMDNDNNNGGANNGGGGDNSGLADFMGGGGGGGGQQQQVPSEIVNLNNAFGSNTNQQNNNDMMSILSQMNDNGNGGGGGNQGAGTNGMDFGNFGNAATNQNQFFPSFF